MQSQCCQRQQSEFDLNNNQSNEAALEGGRTKSEINEGKNKRNQLKKKSENKKERLTGCITIYIIGTSGREPGKLKKYNRIEDNMS